MIRIGSPLRRRVAFGVAAMGYGKLVSAAAQLAMVPALALSWGVAVYGQWLLIASVTTFLAGSDFGFGTAAGTRMIAEVSNGERDDAVITFQSGWAVNLLGSAAVCLAAIAACLLLPDGVFTVADGMQAAEARGVLAVLSVHAIISLQGSIFMAAARSVGRFAVSTTADSTIQLLEGAALATAALLGASPLPAALAFLFFRVAGLAVNVALARRLVPWLPIGLRRASRSRIQELTSPSLAAMFLPLGQAGFLQGTALAVGATAGAAAVPIYTSLRTLSRSCMQLLMVLNLALMPEFTAAYAQRLGPRIKRMLALTAGLSLASGVFSALLMALYGHGFVLWWTGGTVDPPQPMVLLAAAAILAGAIWNPLSNLLLAVNRHMSYTYIYLACAMGAVALTFSLVPRMGITGAAVATLVLEVIMLIAVMTSVVRIFVIAPPRHRGAKARASAERQNIREQ